MSQQHMDFSPPQHTDEQTASYTAGYQQEQAPEFEEYIAGARGQKLVQPSPNTGPTSAQRLALAIVSLSLFVLVFIVAVIMAFLMPSENLKQASPILGVMGFMFGLLLIAVNLAFNQSKK